MEDIERVHIPHRVLGAVAAPHSIASLLVVSRAVYKRALRMFQEWAVRSSVNHCCRLPFLRHMPLKVRACVMLAWARVCLYVCRFVCVCMLGGMHVGASSLLTIQDACFSAPPPCPAATAHSP